MAPATDLALRLAALLSALTAITLEDIAAIKSIDELGPDIAANITNLQALTQSVDQSTIDLLNKERTDSGLPGV